MVRYLDQKGGKLNAKECDKLLFWFAQAGMWGRYSASTESTVDQDLSALEGDDGGLEKLLQQLWLWHGDFRVEPNHFTGWGLGARFYPMLYLISRMGEAQDWGNGLPLKANMLGKMSKLESHHIFPKAKLYKKGFDKTRVNALANFCFLTKNTNLNISDTLPEIYFPRVEEAHPGCLASQWIPQDQELWKIENFEAFLEARKALLADEVNKRMRELMHDETHWLDKTASVSSGLSSIIGGVSDEEEETQLLALNEWMSENQLPHGEFRFDFADPVTGSQVAVFDLVWPNGIQEELTQPVVVLLNEGKEVIAIASQAGYRCFIDINSFKEYVRDAILGEGKAA